MTMYEGSTTPNDPMVPGGASAPHGSNGTATVKEKVAEAKDSMGSLVEQTRGELRSQVDTKGQEAGRALRSVSDQMNSLSQGRPEEAGRLGELLQQAQQRVSAIADRLENDGPQAAMGDVASFARRKPGTFLLAAAATGFVAARLTRAGVAASSDSTTSSSTSTYGTQTPVAGGWSSESMGAPSTVPAPDMASEMSLGATGAGSTSYGDNADLTTGVVR